MSASASNSRALRRSGIVAGSAVAVLSIGGPAFAQLPSGVGAPAAVPAPVATTAPAPPPKCGPRVLINCLTPTGAFVKQYVTPPANPAPLPGVTLPGAGAVTQPVQQGVGALQSGAGSVAGALPGAPALSGLPGAPALPGAPGAPGAAGAPAGSPAASGAAAPAASGAAPAAATAPGATVDNLLGAASAFLPSTLISSFADLGSTPGSLESVPTPDLAGLPESRLQDVQAPLLAAAEHNANDSMLQALRGKVLPGLLIVLATVIVALVGAGNMRVWQTRLAARQG